MIRQRKETTLRRQVPKLEERIFWAKNNSKQYNINHAIEAKFNNSELGTEWLQQISAFR